HVTDVRFSGYQPVYRVTTADGKTIAATGEHRFWTAQGWSTLREAANLNLSPDGVATWSGNVRLAVNGIRPLQDPDWLREMRARGFSANMIAGRLGVSLERVKYRLKTHKIAASNPTAVWRGGITPERKLIGAWTMTN